MDETAEKSHIKELLSSIGVDCDDYDLILQSLTHSSFTFEQKWPSLMSNERLEFLGDSVLKLISSEYLYERFEEYSEGELTKIRASLVSDSTLVKFAKKIKLGKYLLLGFHEEKNGGRERNSTLACAFEALLGALYLEGKFFELQTFLHKIFDEEVTLIDKSTTKSNFKAVLQEHVQSDSLSLPVYKVVKESGPPHNKTFNTEVYVNDLLQGEGKGKSKKEAEQNAAKEALIKLKIIEENIDV